MTNDLGRFPRRRLARLLWSFGLGCTLAACTGSSSAGSDAREDGVGAAIPIAAEALQPIVVGLGPTPLADSARTERLARLLAPIGAAAAMSGCADASWGRMQSGPDAAIDFSQLDAFVRAFQSAGFGELLICLGTYSEWGSRGGPARLRAASPIPRAEYMEEFERWFGAVVERYDGDGRGDMPGLARAVNWFELGSAYSGFGDDYPDGYLALLERAHRALRSASADALLIHAAFLTAGGLDVNAHPGNYEDVFDALDGRVSPLGWRDLQRILDRPDLFDALSVNAQGDASELDALLRWLRWEANRRGYFKPVIVRDAVPTPLVAWGPATVCDASVPEMGIVFAPAADRDRCRLAEFFHNLIEGGPAEIAWAQSFAASDVVKKIVVAADRGVWLVNVGPIEDAAWWKTEAFRAAAGISAWGGLVDSQSDETRPVFHALQQLLETTRGRDRVLRVDVGRSDLYLYEFDGPHGRAWIGWYAAPGVALPGDPIPTEIATIRSGSQRLRIEPLVTRAGNTRAESHVITTQDGIARIEFTPIPIFVYPAS